MEATTSPLRQYLRTAFRWQRGRQRSGYDKMLLLQSLWPLPFDVYILRFPEGSAVPPHTDPVAEGRHYRCNIVLRRAREGGEFACASRSFSPAASSYFGPMPASTASRAWFEERGT